MSTPLCSNIPGTTYALRGPVADYLDNVTAQWLLVAPSANPAMLAMLRDRNRQPLRNLLPWSGEFAGKYLTSAVQMVRLTGDPQLRAAIAAFVERLVSLQADDGYLGPWTTADQLTGTAPNVMGKTGDTWDAWGHYHAMLGLLLWHADSGDPQALQCARRIADLLCTLFLRTDRRLVDTGSTEMNLAVVHSLCLLYRTVPKEEYLDLALQIVDEFAAQGPDGPLAGDYLEAPLVGREFFELPKPRWESLHPIMGLVELYWLTDDDRYRRAFEQIWWSIVKFDRHNNGGFSSGEQAQGNPYHQGAIETCCTIAWIALSVEMLRLTGDARVADELELATLNSVLGLHSQSGRWVTYNTPMDGTRLASAHDIVFQARAGSPELNCCSVNGARGLGMIGDWALLGDDEGVLLNWYGPSTLTTTWHDTPLTLTIEGDYPRSDTVSIAITCDSERTIALKLRIPTWSAHTTVRVNGEAVGDVRAGTYLRLARTWSTGDRIEIVFDFSLHAWAGEQECAGKASLYRGPLLLTYDRRLNDMDPDALPTLDARSLNPRVVPSDGWLAPILIVEVDAPDGQTVRLCDFGSAGEDGSPYRSWLSVENVAVQPFTRTNPLRSSR